MERSDPMQFDQDIIQFEEEVPKMVKMKEALAKYQLKMPFLKRKNMELRETTQKAAKQKEWENTLTKPLIKDKGKQVAFTEQSKEPKIEPCLPTTKVVNLRQGWVQQMKKVAQSPDRPDFDQWKEYKRCLEEHEECQMQVMKIMQDNQDYKKFVQHLLENCDKEVCEASISLDRGKHFVKWSLPTRRK